jgi:predicted ferric reductase
VAGGIGVTPFLSLLRQERERTAGTRSSGALPPITMVWSVRNHEEAVYLAEIEGAVAELPHVRFCLHVSNEAGYLTAEQLAQLHQPEGLAASTVFLCGPPAMMKSLTMQCRKLGLPRNRLVMEEFAMR